MVITDEKYSRAAGMLTLKPNFTPGAQVVQDRADGWHLEIPAGSKGHYQLAQ